MMDLQLGIWQKPLPSHFQKVFFCDDKEVDGLE